MAEPSPKATPSGTMEVEKAPPIQGNVQTEPPVFYSIGTYSGDGDTYFTQTSLPSTPPDFYHDFKSRFKPVLEALGSNDD